MDNVPKIIMILLFMVVITKIIEDENTVCSAIILFAILASVTIWGLVTLWKIVTQHRAKRRKVKESEVTDIMWEKAVKDAPDVGDDYFTWLRTVADKHWEEKRIANGIKAIADALAPVLNGDTLKDKIDLIWNSAEKQIKYCISAKENIYARAGDDIFNAINSFVDSMKPAYFKQRINSLDDDKLLLVFTALKHYNYHAVYVKQMDPQKRIKYYYMMRLIAHECQKRNTIQIPIGDKQKNESDNSRVNEPQASVNNVLKQLLVFTKKFKNSIMNTDNDVYVDGLQDFGLNDRTVGDNNLRLLRESGMKFFPGNSEDNFEAIYDMLSPVLEIEKLKSMLESGWTHARSMCECDGADKKAIVYRTFAATAVWFERYIGILNMETGCKPRIASLDDESLLKAFIALDFYAYMLTPRFKTNLVKLKEMIARELLKRSTAKKEHIEKLVIVRIENQSIYIDLHALREWAGMCKEDYKYNGYVPLTESTPVISVYENGELAQNYTLETVDGENFAGKYLNIQMWLNIEGDPLIPFANISGYIADAPNDEELSIKTIFYRFEVLFLDKKSDATKIQQARLVGNNLYTKALRAQGLITPSNVRLVGICQACHKSFAFIGYYLAHMQAEPAYSDDGLDVYALNAYEEIDKSTWSVEKEGKTFRYYNSFRCPHCGEPYLDYQKYPTNKEYGNLGCMLLGRKVYQ